MEADVSSQDDSIAKIVMGVIRLIAVNFVAQDNHLAKSLTQ
jgi:hypothetical protein